MKYCPLCRSDLSHRNIGGQTRLACPVLGHFPLPQLNLLIIAFELRATGTLVLSDEIAEVKLVSPAELASFDFGPLRLTHDIVSSWLKEGHHAGA